MKDLLQWGTIMLASITIILACASLVGIFKYSPPAEVHVIIWALIAIGWAYGYEGS